MVPALVFLIVFLIAAFFVATGGTGRLDSDKKTQARLETVLAADIMKSDADLTDFERKETLSAIPILNRILQQLSIAPRLRLSLYQANLKWTPGGLILMAFSAWVFSSYLIYLRISIAIVSMIFGLIPAVAPFAYVFYRRSQTFQRFEASLPQALDLMVSALRGGQSLVAAIGLVGREVPDPVGHEFQICYDEQNFGLPFRTAMENLAVRMPIPDIRIIKTAILVQRETGGNLAEVLDKCAYVIRERFRLKKEIRIKTAQGRITGWILTFLPVVLGIILFLFNPESISLLWTRKMGQNMLYAGAIMTLIGGLVIRKIVRIRV